MAQHGGYQLNLKLLSQGRHRFEYELDGDFFAQAESYDIVGGAISAVVDLERSSDVFHLTITLDGVVRTACDRCLEEVEIPVSEEVKLVVRFGESYEELSDDLLVLPLAEGVLDLGSLLYEYSELALPMQRMHEEGGCNPDMMDRIGHIMAVDTTEAEGDDVPEAHDARWDVLGQLLEQKNNLNK